MLTRDAESADFGGKRPPCWPEIPVAGIRLRDLSLPPFALDMEMQTWKAAARHPSSSGLEKGIITDFAKKPGLS